MLLQITASLRLLQYKLGELLLNHLYENPKEFIESPEVVSEKGDQEK